MPCPRKSLPALCISPLKSLTLSRRCFATRSGLTDPSSQYFKVHDEVREAVASQKPVVALETAIYTHGRLTLSFEAVQRPYSHSGFPYPANVALASRLESLVRLNGGIPATIGVFNGVARVGLEAEELIELAASAGQAKTIKVSRRDLAFACGSV